MPVSSLPIALFDSGVGGLTVFKAIRDLLPHENLLYLGDTARLPYGTKSEETIIRYTSNAAARLAQRGIKMLVIACNTATSAALPILQNKLAPLPVLGVVKPGATAAVNASRNGRIAVLATEATIRGGAYQKAIGEIWPNARIIPKACTLFVSLAEEGWASGEIATAVAKEYLKDIFFVKANNFSKPDTLLLGCTHFPLFLNTLKNILGPGINIVDSAYCTAIKVQQSLKEAGILKKATYEHSPTEHFLTTDNKDRFAKTGSLFLGKSILAGDVELVDL